MVSTPPVGTADWGVGAAKEMGMVPVAPVMHATGVVVSVVLVAPHSVATVATPLPVLLRYTVAPGTPVVPFTALTVTVVLWPAVVSVPRVRNWLLLSGENW